MTEYQLYALLISVLTALGGGAGIYYGTAWLDRREQRRRQSRPNSNTAADMVGTSGALWLRSLP
jgi:hypothetical protein